MGSAKSAYVRRVDSPNIKLGLTCATQYTNEHLFYFIRGPDQFHTTSNDAYNVLSQTRSTAEEETGNLTSQRAPGDYELYASYVLRL